MSTVTTIPLIVDQEAAEHIAQLGMQAEFERMIEYTRQTVPGLQHIHVWLQPPYDTGDDLGVIIEITRNDPWHLDDPTDEQWKLWLIETFSPDVLRHFTRLSQHEETNHAR
jgi:hypothetical protein